MSGKNYDNPMTLAYHFPSVAIDTAADFGVIVGPKGKIGRLRSISTYITVATTVAASEIRVGTAADPDAYGIQAIPISAIGSVINTITDYTGDQTTGTDDRIPADTAVHFESDGGATAGDGHITVVIDWY